MEGGEGQDLSFLVFKELCAAAILESYRIFWVHLNIPVLYGLTMADVAVTPSTGIGIVSTS